jgi:hypothetical protein
LERPNALLVGLEPATGAVRYQQSFESGITTGPHLHYQLDLAGEAVDPLRYRAGHPKTVAAGASD